MSDAKRPVPPQFVGKNFQKGQSGNPGGRPKGYAGIAAMIRKETNHGKELVDYSLAVLRDTKADWRSRDAARNWLGEYAFGKAPQTVKLTDDREEVIDWTKLSDEDLATYVEIREKMGVEPELGDGVQ